MLFGLIITPMGSSPSALWTDHLTIHLDRPEPYLSIQAIKIFVRDQDQSLRFYVDQLGFSLVSDVQVAAGQRWVTVAPPDGSAVLSLVAPKPDSKEYELIGKPTPVVFVTDDVLAKFREWRRRGVRFQYTPRLRRVKYERQAPAPGPTDPSLLPGDRTPIWGGVFTRFKDPDDNSFTLVSFDEVNQAIEAQRGAAAAKLES